MSAIDFTMNYYALKMFGRQQYSNVWAALSELVANGFDAGASNVYLYIDMRNKSHSTIEIIDDGSGMSEEDLREKYVKIGRNRRKDNPDDKAAGRKGIGKLAALYLSDTYQIISIKEKSMTAWSVNVAGKQDTDTPCLKSIDPSAIQISCGSKWNASERKNGTMIRLLDVDLNRIGDRMIDSLKRRLSNYFLLKEKRTLNIKIIQEDNQDIDFVPIKKEIAFDNMYYILCSDKSLITTKKSDLIVEYDSKSNGIKELKVEKTVSTFPNEVTKSDKTAEKISLSGELDIDGKKKAYSVTGWIGVHASIESKSARKNDTHFIRNKYYTPNQIRIYVRNKLANDSFLSKLNLTGTYANYIEGEVSFDILDDNDLEDIATTNRQDFSIDDSRITLLVDILRSLCRILINKRNELAQKVKDAQKRDNEKENAKRKTHFAHETHQDLLSAGITPEKADELSMVISNKLTGEFDLKTAYKVFISHSSKDRIFTDFIVNYLTHRGFHWDMDADKTEIFYSSDGTDIRNTTPLAEIIRQMLVNANTDILFFTSENSMKSQYCLFEGGAAWATRSVADYSIISLDYSSIPEYLTNGKPEFTFNTKDKTSFCLNERSYKNLVIILNRLISHLNKNKVYRKEPLIELIPDPIFEDKVQMKRKGKHLEDYMDPDICQYWQEYVLSHIDEYLTPSTPAESISKVI